MVTNIIPSQEIFSVRADVDISKYNNPVLKSFFEQILTPD